MTETPLTEAECDLKGFDAGYNAFAAIYGKHISNQTLRAVRAACSAYDAEARRQLGDDRRAGWDAAIEAAANLAGAHSPKQPAPTQWQRMSDNMRESVRDEQRGETIGAAIIRDAIRALTPPSSWPVSPLVEENARLREALKAAWDNRNDDKKLWKIIADIIAPAGKLDDADMTWAKTQIAEIEARATLATHKPREVGE